MYIRFPICGVGTSGVALFLAVVEDRDAILDEGPRDGVLDQLNDALESHKCNEYRTALTPWSVVRDWNRGLSWFSRKDPTVNSPLAYADCAD